MKKRLRRSRCKCGREVWDDQPDQRIEPGCFCVCAYCGAVQRITEDYSLENVSMDAVPPESREEIANMRIIALLGFGPGLINAEAKLRRSRS